MRPSESEVTAQSVSDKTKPIGAVPSQPADAVAQPPSAVHMAEPASMAQMGQTPPSKPDPFIGAKIAHYRIESLLGRGGMGKVYKARNINLNKTSALKILPPEFAAQDRSLVDRFIREARSAAAIEHPNVLPVQFVGKVEENYFIEMQYVDGGTLADLLKKRGRLDVKEAARIMRDVAAGLEAAHKKGIIHRDMKPTNVMLRSDGHVYVADFGLAKVAQARTQLTQQGEVMGTPIYMSPEQALGAKVDLRSDIYSLGIMFYQILSGRPPYIDDSALVILEKHRSSPIPDVSSIVPGVPEQIGAMIVKMMAKRREDRYRSCAEIVQELNTYIETGTPGVVVSEEVFREADEARRTMRLGKRPSRPSSPRKPLKINRKAALGIVVAIVVVVVIGLAALYFTTETRRAQRTAEKGSGTARTAVSADERRLTQIGEKAESPARGGGKEGKKRESVESAKSVEKSFDDLYVTTAATGEKIPHPLSKKTYAIEYQGQKIEVPEGMVYVPAGSFTMGEKESEHRVYLDAYFIGKYEVTNAEWKAFVDSTWAVTVPDHWKNRTFPEGKENCPVSYVSWEEVKRYCDWVTKETRRDVRLPTEAQWEKAARGPQAFRYPWGNKCDWQSCNNGYQLGKFGFKPTSELNEAWLKALKEWANSPAGQAIVLSGGNTSPVGSFPQDKSSYACYDLAGNVMEWCSDWYRADHYTWSHVKENPQGPTEQEADLMPKLGGKAVVIRGGCWDTYSSNCLAYGRHALSPTTRWAASGVRVVVVPRSQHFGVTPAEKGAPPKAATTEEKPSAPSAQKGVWDQAYVTTAATGEKIPHPLSRKTTRQTLADGTTIDVPEGMVCVPAGTFTMGEGESEHRVYLDAYFIGKYEVTNAEWKVFTELAGFEPLPQHWKDGKIPAGKENHPVVYVSWEDAQKYCEWATRLSSSDGGQDSGAKWEVRLPTEAQWEKAARGPEAYIYPWGNQWDKNLCNNGWLLAPFGFKPNNEGDDWYRKYDEWGKSDIGKQIIASGGNTMPVGSFPKGISFYGCYDMAGNASEWCADWFMTNYFKLKDAKRNPEGPSEEEAEEKDFSGKKSKARLLRGGSWNDFSGLCRSVYRHCYSPSARSNRYGFRVVVSVVR